MENVLEQIQDPELAGKLRGATRKLLTNMEGRIA